MKKLERYRDFEKLIKTKSLLFSMPRRKLQCLSGGCLKSSLAEIYKDGYNDALMEDLPEIRGQLGIFTVPVAILYYQGREYHRQARIIDMSELEGRIKEVSENMQDFGG